jgi:hypothetical protein
VSRPTCGIEMNDGADHVHQCELGDDHTDSDWPGSHQCECGETW